MAENTNPDNLECSLKEALAGADVFIGVSAPRVIDAAAVATMADRAIVFALANPEPEIDPAEATLHAEVVATGRSDFPNQINNVLAFPGVFRGLLDARSTDITPAMLIAAARALASVVGDDELNATYITPSVFHADVHRRVAQAVRVAAGGPAELPTDTEVRRLSRPDAGRWRSRWGPPLLVLARRRPSSASRSGCTVRPVRSGPRGSRVPTGRSTP